jgi:hypothetical protein
MTDTPEHNKPRPGDSQDPAEEAAPQSATPKPQVRAPSKPVKPPSKPTPKPISITPDEKKSEAAPKPAPAQKADSSITFDEENNIDDDVPGVAMLVVDGLAAAVAVAFTVLIFLDVSPSL